MKTVLVRFTVEGHGSFPMDMLRYDMCWPIDAAAVDQLSMEPVNPDYFKTRQVKLCSSCSRITINRWMSFGWKVVER